MAMKDVNSPINLRLIRSYLRCRITKRKDFETALVSRSQLTADELFGVTVPKHIICSCSIFPTSFAIVSVAIMVILGMTVMAIID